ncbi:MAG: hypothetical protein IJW37_06915, partial [Lachnospiraceae bacterium]|nr:hypothetical protein [Lachnospiraceae bacterium]
MLGADTSNVGKKGFQMKLKENRKMQLLFCVLSVALIWGMYAVMATWVEGNVAREKAIAREESFDPKVLLQVENASIEDGKLNISGWVSRYNSELSKVYGVLKAVDGSEEHILKGRLVESAAGNEDLKRVKMEGMESASCFELNVKEQKLKKDVCYEILIDLTYTIQTDDKKREEGEKISTAQYLYNGEVYNYIPTQFHAPEFADEKMKKV